MVVFGVYSKKSPGIQPRLYFLIRNSSLSHYPFPSESNQPNQTRAKEKQGCRLRDGKEATDFATGEFSRMDIQVSGFGR
jgi:hypothetical protein